MKTELPKKSASHKDAIYEIRDKILSHCEKRVAFIILFGSFARGDWVFDRQYKEHYIEEYASDYDILVITNKSKHISDSETIKLESALERKLSPRIIEVIGPRKHAHTPTLIVECITRVNKKLHEGQYFFSDIKREGILLYDSGTYELAEAGKLPPEKMKQLAEEDFQKWFTAGENFLEITQFAIQKNMLNEAAFSLHQATERFFYCALLVLTGYKPKLHNIEKLNKLCSAHHHEFLRIFPRGSEQEETCFKLLKAAYIDARYNKNYSITQEQLQYLITRVDILKTTTESICKQWIEGLV